MNTTFLSGKLKGGVSLGGIGVDVDGRIISVWVLREQGMVLCPEFSCIKVRPSGCCEHGKELS
jgi:hypothetical protein